VEIAPREGEVTLRTDDILAVIEKAGTELCLVMLSGVQYYTGQLFDMEAITQAGHAQGAIVGFDLAHAAGNVPLRLHDWGVDFAVWCSYKYLNCGPGSIAGAFVHERHGTAGDAGAADEADRTPRVRLAGWWGHRQSDRFDMAPEFVPCQGAYGYRCSNPPVLLVACLRASLDLYDRATMPALREKSLKLTGYLEYLLQMMIGPEHVSIFTPSNQAQRGAQLSLKFSADLGTVFDEMSAKGFVCDVRKVRYT
jgi:kynureninase